MSSTPPPPFSPYSGQSSFDRRTLRAQRRAATQQARLRRDQFRSQMRAARRRSIVGPILLVALGSVLLVVQAGYLGWPQVLAWLGRWWPAVLIIAGCIMVAEWALDRRQLSPEGAMIGPRRFLGGGAVTLLILLALVGAGMMAAENGSAWARHNLDQSVTHNGFGDWRQVFGVRSETTETLHTPLSADGSLTINDPHGDVEVTGSSTDGEVHVSVTRHIFAWQRSDADRRQAQEQVRFSGDHSHLVLAAPSQDQDDADLTVEMPHGASLALRSDHGDLSVEELRGAVDLVARDGDVKLTGLSGPVRLQTQDDDATVTAHSLGAGFSLEGRSGDINLSDVDGPVVLHGDFFGTTHLERIRGTVHFQSSFTDFACARIPGDLNVEGRSDLDAHRIEGPVTVSTTNRNLNLDGVRGSLTVADRNGSVDLTLNGSAAPVHVSNENGSLTLALPETQGYSLTAQTKNGNIQNDFGLPADKAGETARLSGQIAHGGPLISLQTSEGDIQLRKAPNGEASSWDDQPTRITPAPLSGTKRTDGDER